MIYKWSLLTLVLSIAVSGAVLAKQPRTGGFDGPSVATVSAAEALKMRDDTPVVLKGHIEKHLGGDKYLFRDETGTLTVDIDGDEWNGLTVTPEDLVEISGEVDKEWTSFKIDAENVRLAQ